MSPEAKLKLFLIIQARGWEIRAIAEPHPCKGLAEEYISQVQEQIIALIRSRYDLEDRK